MVGRDEGGYLLLVATRSDEAKSAEEAELKTIAMAISIANQEGWPKVFIEGDCKALLTNLKNRGESHSWRLSYRFHCVKIFCKNFVSIKFAWILRCCNSNADRLGKWSKTHSVSGE